MAEARCEQRRFSEAAPYARAAIGVVAQSTSGYAQLGRALYEQHEQHVESDRLASRQASA